MASSASRRNLIARGQTSDIVIIWIVSGIAFMVTGFSGLVFEVLWIRLLSGVFGTTIHATSTTLAAFLGGLGIGALVIGRYVDQHAFGLRQLLQAFAACEGIAAILALLLCLLLPRLAALAALVGGGDLTTSLLIGRALATVLLLFVPTFFMGGSLPILSKALLLVSPRVGSTVGTLYAINTLGAALGALLVDSWLVMNLGIARSAGVAAAGTVAVAVLILTLLPRPRRALKLKPTLRGPSERQPSRRQLLLFVYAVSGFCALGYEVAWSRVLLNEVFSSRFAISTMLGVVLLGLVLGSTLMSSLLRIGVRVILALVSIEVLTAASALGGFYALNDWAPALRAMAARWVDSVVPFSFLGVNLVGVADCLPQVLVLEGAPSVLLGAILPLVAEGIVPGAITAGRNVGLVYLFNTLGTIAGAMLTGFLFLPLLGAEGSLQLLATLNILLGGRFCSRRHSSAIAYWLLQDR